MSIKRHIGQYSHNILHGFSKAFKISVATHADLFGVATACAIIGGVLGWLVGSLVSVPTYGSAFLLAPLVGSYLGVLTGGIIGLSLGMGIHMFNAHIIRDKTVAKTSFKQVDEFATDFMDFRHEFRDDYNEFDPSIIKFRQEFRNKVESVRHANMSHKQKALHMLKHPFSFFHHQQAKPPQVFINNSYDDFYLP